jgi:hypothetical protein
MSLCLAAGALSAVLAVNAFTLSWIHSIEKIRWEEDWRIEAGALVIDEARIRGSGAGMEPPPGRCSGRRLALPAGTAAAGRVAPGAFAACRRLHAVHRDGLRPACRLPAGDRQ